jgi:DNA-directed RNA polymerase subunit RPC12/RpoP
MGLFTGNTWILKCYRCEQLFDLVVASTSEILQAPHSAICPNCGHVPTLSGSFPVAADTHIMIRIKLPAKPE